jgi:hypothetical protein
MNNNSGRGKGSRQPHRPRLSGEQVEARQEISNVLTPDLAGLPAVLVENGTLPLHVEEAGGPWSASTSNVRRDPVTHTFDMSAADTEKALMEILMLD